MLLNEKDKISDALKERMESKKLSQAMVSASINGCSPATVNGIVNKKWKDDDKLVSEKMFHKIAAWLGLEKTKTWVVTESDKNLKKVGLICSFAKEDSHSKMIVAPPGHGKSQGLRLFSERHPDVFYIECGDFWTKKTFLEKLKTTMGLPQSLSTVPEMVEEVLQKLNTMDKPLIIIDEMDKLSTKVFPMFNYLYNNTLDRCGFVLAGAPYLRLKVEKGLLRNYQSYKELFSRVGGGFLNLNTPSPESIEAICIANGLTDSTKITQVINFANGDYRRVKSKVELLKLNKSNDNDNE